MNNLFPDWLIETLIHHVFIVLLCCGGFGGDGSSICSNKWKPPNTSTTQRIVYMPLKDCMHDGVEKIALKERQSFSPLPGGHTFDYPHKPVRWPAIRLEGYLQCTPLYMDVWNVYLHINRESREGAYNRRHLGGKCSPLLLSVLALVRRKDIVSP